jgi:hypothetical protein
MEMHQIKNLLDQVNAITTRYKKINELTGENFNVFRILKLESSEVRMHSAFIAELLNPNGSHGQKTVFLDLFVKAFCFKENIIDTKSCKVRVEENIGSISDDRTQGGRIDIIITDKYFNQIIIENKINAGDQEFQLTRYHNYSSNADIMYLTLGGKSPSDNSKGDMQNGEHFKCYSYKHDILNWLELCRKEVSVFPIVREGLTHYINLIKYLTNQTPNKTMQEELSELLKSNLEASFAIFDNLDSACNKISDDFGKSMINECEQLGVECYYGVDFDERFNGIWICRKEWKYLNIGFQFQSYDKELRYGIVAKKNPNGNPIPDEIQKSVNVLPKNTPKTNVWWPWYKQMEEPYDNWSKFQAWKAIRDGHMKDNMIEKVKYLLEITKDLEM